MSKTYKTTIALVFSVIFHIISLSLIILSFYIFTNGLFSKEHDLITLIIKSINTLVISLAMYELGVGVRAKVYFRICGELLLDLWGQYASP
mgnify:CR=1 FL=1